MLIVALLMIKSGFSHIFEGPGIIAKLKEISPALAGVTNASSPYFRDLFEVFFCNFLVGLAIVCQPHILGKALLLKDNSQIKTYLGTAFAAGSVFVLIMVVGLYARISLPGVIQRSDTVVPAYIAQNFSPSMLVLISMGLLCAGISTLEGILLSLSSIFSNDIYPFIRPQKEDEQTEEYASRALRFGRISLCIIGVICIYMSISQIQNPVGGSVAIFAQYGIYLLFSVFFLPLGCGMFIPSMKSSLVKIGVAAACAGYFIPLLIKWPVYHNNPAFLAASSIILSWTVVGIGHRLMRS
jgi:Na+/pantothenate symporter